MESKLKKISLLVINSVLIIVLLCCFWIIGEMVIVKLKFNISVESVLKKQDSDKVLNIDYSEYIRTEGNIKDSRVAYVNKILNVVPKTILDSFFVKGGVVVITDKDIATTYYGSTDLGRIAGLHNSSNNVVYISNNICDIDKALVHEFGHVLDSLTDWGSKGEDFKAIYISEKDTFEVYSTDDHYKSNEKEFFAEVFQEYILNPKNCEASAKGAFDFVGDKIKSLKVD